MGQITETNQQYYQGVQGFRGTGNALTITTTFNTDLVYGSWNPRRVNDHHIGFSNHFKCIRTRDGHASCS